MEKLLKETEEIVALLKEKNIKIATAESCTGGMLSAALVSIPGASAVFELGVTAYSAEMKERILGVKSETIRQHGTISRHTAAEMAAGVRRISKADIGVSVTGVAGPDPAEGKTPGTVYIALADGKNVRMEKLILNPDSREKVRRATCSEIFRLIRNYFADIEEST